tara:strand:- start:953 stop:1495 length:543 start_codon:yes stop_codon:yes gene_type:complete
MIKLKTIKIIAFLAFSSLLLNACKGGLPGADARKFPADPEKRIQKNIAEGKSLQMNEIFGNTQGGRVFDFASSNGLWRASLDVIDFMPLSSVNYSGGIIITDWYSENSNQKESIKISIRFMTNELRSDALNIKVFNRKCLDNLLNCKVTETSGVLVAELKKEILKKATIYQEQDREKKKK